MYQTAQTRITARAAAGRFRLTTEIMMKWAQNGLIPMRTDTAELLILWNMLEAALCRQPRPLGASAHGR